LEINRFEEVNGVVAQANIVEGRMVKLSANVFTADFGSLADLPGAHVPATAEEATRAKYIVTFALDNRPTPIYGSNPAYSWSLRAGGWDQATNVPFTTEVFETHQANQEGLTIPSGTACLAFTDGVFTLRAADYVDSVEIRVPGNALIVSDTASDGAAAAGKLRYAAATTVGVVGETHSYDSTTGKLTVILYG
jgi:hypothetical protein